MISYGGHWLATHHKVDHASYLSAFKRLHTHERFPNYIHISTFSGSLGPDMLWTRGLQKTSWHVYNPKTKKGNAGSACQHFYDELVSELVKKRPRMIRAGRFAAWLSHFAVDSLSPNHQVGRHKIKEPVRDWFDPHWDDEKHYLFNLRDNHAYFETMIAFFYLFRRTPLAKVDTDFTASSQQKYKGDAVKVYVEKEARKIYRWNMYTKFKKEGFSKEVRHLVYDHMIPSMVSLVATLWQSAFLESQRIMAHAQHHQPNA